VTGPEGPGFVTIPNYFREIVSAYHCKISLRTRGTEERLEHIG
jgi:hypothetical protein